MLKHLAICLALLTGTSIARASLTIDVGDISLVPGTAGQKVLIYVHGGDAVIQAQLRIQIAGGGLAVPGQSITGPTITSVDMVNGTIFDSNNNGQSPDYYDCVLFPQLASCGTMTKESAVSAEGLLATITVDTSTCTELNQEFALELKDTIFVNSPNTQFNGGDVQVNITNGSIVISSNVPEPATGLLGLAGVGMLLRRRPRGAGR